MRIGEEIRFQSRRQGARSMMDCFVISLSTKIGFWRLIFGCIFLGSYLEE